MTALPVIRRLSYRADPIASSPTSLGCLADDGPARGGVRAGCRRQTAQGGAGIRGAVGRRCGAHRDGIGARSGRLGLPCVPKHSVRGTAGGAVALAVAAARGALVGDVGRHQSRPAMHAGHRPETRSGQADQRELPDAQRLDAAARPTRREARGDGLDPRGRVRPRQRRHLSLALAGGQRPHHRRHDQLPTRCAGLPGSSVARPARHGRAITDWPTSRPRCAGFATTSPRSAATRRRSPSPANPPAACRCATT